MSAESTKKSISEERLRTISDVNTDMLDYTQESIDSFDSTKHQQRSRANLEQSWPLYRDLLKQLSRYTYIPADTLNNYVRTIVFLILFSLMLPLNLFITLFTIIYSKVIHSPQQNLSNPNKKRILISGGMMTKALELCRAFHKAGHEVILFEEAVNWLSGARWSNSVKKFYILPAAERQPEAYIQALEDIVQKEKIDMFVPVTSPYHAHIDSKAKTVLAKYGCTTCHMDLDELALVDNKYTFTDKARSLGLTVPKSFYITSRKQLLDFNFDNERRPYICKSIIYDWLDRGTNVTLPLSTRAKTIEYINRLPVSEEFPYILQEFIQGQEYCTHGTCLDGQLTLFTCSHSSAWQLNYQHIEHPEIFQWCQKFVKELNLTGHPSFDFIVSNDDGKPYGIECNPRVHSAITAFYNQPNTANAYFKPILTKPIVPSPTARETYWLPHELWRIFRNIKSKEKVLQSVKRLIYGKEAIWSSDDPLPFLLHYHVHFIYLLLDNLRPSVVRFFNKIDCCIGELA